MTNYTYDELNEGDVHTFEFTASRESVDLFAKATGDSNPVHMDEEFAKTTPFGGCIAHGVLSIGYISAVLGRDFPGNGTIYLSQTAKFLAPVPVGSTLKVSVQVVEKLLKGTVKLNTSVFLGETLVVSGEALVKAPRVKI